MSRLEHARYQPGAVLGRGAQAVVMRVIDREAPERALVAKVWQPGVFEEELLAGEFALLARLHVPGLVRAHDLGRDERTGAPFLVEDFIDGPDAREWLLAAPEGRARVERLARLLGEVTTTLGLIHEAGFLHGDLKPAHVRVPAAGRATLLDLGAAVARARSESSATAITHGYAAPELLAGRAPSPRSDLFALGALAFSIATGRPAEARAPVRSLAPWIPPSLGDVIDRLAADHPEDRPADARDALEWLGRSWAFTEAPRTRAQRAAASGASPRERELASLQALAPGAHYLSGPAGSGKSHTLSELLTRALLDGRAARLVRFPCEDQNFMPALIAWLRGNESARPFPKGPLLVAFDDLDRAPLEVRAAVEAFRCRPRDPDDVTLIGALRTAPTDTRPLSLGALDERGVRELCRELGVDETRAPELSAASEGNPGFLVALLGKAPLTRAAALERVRTLSAPTRRALGSIAVLGGRANEDWLTRVLGATAVKQAFAELSRAGLIRRSVTASEVQLSMVHGEIVSDLADALADFDVVDTLASAVLDRGAMLGAHALSCLAAAPRPPTRRSALLALAARRAKEEGLRSEETEALLALAADPRERTRETLAALDRATRGGGSAGLHPELVSWLEEAAAQEPDLAVLALRRRAEQKARAGDRDAALALAERAVTLAKDRGDTGQLGLAYSTLASLALYRADWNAAEHALSKAMAALSTGVVDDTEEVARLDHNRGVVALYRGRLEEARLAFERSLAAKRALGDRGGTWACLLNLGLALGQLGRYDQAETALSEGVATCRALGQLSGAGWCLAALADVCVRRSDPKAAERHIAEAEHLGDIVPKPVHADLALLRAELALLEGDGDRALSEIARVDPELVESDAFIGARSATLSARAHLVTLPADRRLAARTAIRAIRRARAAGLGEPEARALAVLGEARRRFASVTGRGYSSDRSMTEDSELWSFLKTAQESADREEAALSLARWVVEASAAERVFLLCLDANGRVQSGVGIDIDGMRVEGAEERLPKDVLERALSSGGVSNQPTVTTRAGRGSRLVVLSPTSSRADRAALVLEHRFVAGAFDALDRTTVERWGVCAGLALALGAPARAEAAAAARAPEASEPEFARSEPSTVLPGRGRRHAFPSIAGKSAAIERALARLDTAVDSDLPVLITGETGVGKELFARALHDEGPRAKAPFVAINCGAVPDSLFEAELFGHARGSFTGADRARAGLIARAEGGTLFLDEIGELPLMRQATLLRVLAEKRYRPVGSDEDRPFDVRIVAATNRDLEHEVNAGSFRRDLLYRLNVLEVRVPPLRERPEDIVPIAERVLADTGRKSTVTPRAARALASYRWPGNVRELEHQIQRVAALGVPRIELEHLAREVRAAFKDTPASRISVAPPKLAAGPDQEREEVLAALESEQGNITRTAERLRLTRQGLKKKMVRLGLREPKASGG